MGNAKPTARPPDGSGVHASQGPNGEGGHLSEDSVHRMRHLRAQMSASMRSRSSSTPQADEAEVVHRYGYNGFRLYRLPIPPTKGITGLLGPNGTGRVDRPPRPRGSRGPEPGRFQDPGHLGRGPRTVPRDRVACQTLAHPEGGATDGHGNPNTSARLAERAATTVSEWVSDTGGDATKALNEVGLPGKGDRKLSELSGGELQMAAIARTLATDADLYLFDGEPSSLSPDIVLPARDRPRPPAVGGDEERDRRRTRPCAPGLPRGPGPPRLWRGGRVRRDLAPLADADGGQHVLTGYTAGRKCPVPGPGPGPLRVAHRNLLSTAECAMGRHGHRKRFPKFTLSVGGGSLAKGETIGIVGPNATGKTTFVKMLAGVETPTARIPIAGQRHRQLQAPVPEGDPNCEPEGADGRTGQRPDVRWPSFRARADPGAPPRGRSRRRTARPLGRRTSAGRRGAGAGPSGDTLLAR